MKRSLKNISGYSIQGKYGTSGKVVDLLFDEESWIVRYIEAAFEEFDPPQRVLIPRTSLKAPDWEDKTFHLDLTLPDIEASPTIEEHLPVSREYEKKILEHYKEAPYWPYMYVPPTTSVMPYPPRPLKVPAQEINEEELDSRLRSFKEIINYRIRGTDDSLGQVEDIIVDDEDWQITYLIVDTKRWLPWSKTVVLSIEWLEKISYQKSEVQIDLAASQIKKAPEFDPSHPIDMDYEKALDAFYREQKKELHS
jgi:sporulation protein YlmC with PRC-barrel domain